MTVSKNRQHFDFKNFLIWCILDYAQRHLVDFWKKRPANFNFIWLEWNSYNSRTHFQIVWSCSSIFKLKSSSAWGWYISEVELNFPIFEMWVIVTSGQYPFLENSSWQRLNIVLCNVFTIHVCIHNFFSKFLVICQARKKIFSWDFLVVC